MNSVPHSGHDGPYPSPVEIRGFSVIADWIDYNKHMNVGYYGVVFDQALEHFLGDHLGLAAQYVETAGAGPYIVQSHLQFLRELLEGEKFFFRFRLLDHDHKRLIYFAQMYSERDNVLCATQEALLMNVSQSTGRSADFPAWAMTRLNAMQLAHSELGHEPQMGRALAIRRAG